MKTHFDSTRLMKLTLPLSLIKVIYIVKSSKQFSISLVVNIIKRSHPFFPSKKASIECQTNNQLSINIVLPENLSDGFITVVRKFK